MAWLWATRVEIMCVGGHRHASTRRLVRRCGFNQWVVMLAYPVDAREAVVLPAPAAVGLDLGVERRGGVERDSIEAPRVGASQPAVVRDDGTVRRHVRETNGPLGRRVGAPPEVAPLDERRDEGRPLRDGAERQARRPPRLLAARGQRRRAWRDSYDRGEAPAHVYDDLFRNFASTRGVQAKSARESSAAWFGSRVLDLVLAHCSPSYD